MILGIGNRGHDLPKLKEFREAVLFLPRGIRYMALDIQNKYANPLVQLFISNNVMMKPGTVYLFYVGKNQYYLWKPSNNYTIKRSFLNNMNHKHKLKREKEAYIYIWSVPFILITFYNLWIEKIKKSA